MVEMDVQFLAGVAVTVFLALLFFGVVVLWDLSLALRSVGDKVDKLEDTLDDGLTDVGHNLEGFSHGSGGGTQLHLSSGTISSGPTQGQPQQGQQPQQAPHQAQAGQAYAQPQPAHEDQAERAEPTSEADQARADDFAAVDEAATQSTEPESVDPGESNDDSAESVDRGREGDEQVDTASDGDGEDELDDAEDEDSAPDDALVARNRGRFITSPDRTAWYATSLDRDAIADAKYPPIAGELEGAPEPNAGDSSSGDDGEGSGSGDGDEQRLTDEGDDDAETATDDESTVYAAPPANSPDSPEAVRQPTADGSGGAGLEASSDADGNVDVESDHLDTATASDSDPAPGTGADGGEFTFSEAVTGEADTENERRYGDGDGDEEAANTDAADDDAAVETERDSFLETPAPRESTDLDEASDDGAVEVVGDDPDELDELEEADEPDAPDDTAAAFDPFDPADHVDSVEDDIEEIPVDRALETLNEEKPDLSLSSHGFEVSAEENEDGAVLTYTFDPETVSITGSTKRLLTYQLQSFADQESTPDGDVTIDGQRIVIDVPDADGAAIQRWGQGAVSIIDRTLYLSDNGN